MAYDANNEKQIEYGLIQKNSRGEYFRVARVIPNGSSRLQAVDIRTMYTDDTDTIRPTSKGVRVSSESIVEVATAIFKAMSIEEKEEFLDALTEINGNGSRDPGCDEEDTYEDDEVSI